MHFFYVKTRKWPTGETLAPTEGVTFGGPPDVEDRAAPEFVATGPGSVLQFLFWHTGRRITGKRNVRWNFTTMTWTVWEATKWYGVPGDGGGGPGVIHAEAFSLISNDRMMVDTPISGVTGGATWPFMGNNNNVGTASGPGNIAGIDPLSGLSLCGWQKLVWGGNPDPDPFIESDADVTATNVPGDGSGNVFTFTPGATLHVAQNEGGEALAAYGSSGPPEPPGRHIFDILKWIELDRGRRPWDIRADPPPWDILRRRLVEDLITRTEPGAGPATDFNSIINAVPNMSADDLKRAQSSVKTQVDLGQTALSSIEAQMKRLGKTK
ncbi:MAG TPA: hypothetical protein VM733_15490 [Thermoanaerobaculia bacterium]|nr:hypothetical protein [Thermoanaerobaculia bacterium]